VAKSDQVLGDGRSGGGRPVVSRVARDADRYEIKGEHGRGGLGRVSRVFDRDLQRDIAIKELISRGEVSEARFLREALITARLEHPGIVPIYEAGCWDDGTPFYAMKLVSGRPLRELIGERATVDARLDLLHHVIAVADAMAYAHDHHIIHRDLKPANVIVGAFGETVVIDWGLAKDLSASEPDEGGAGSPPSPDLDLTVTGSVLGTPAYMPPEQARGEHVDQRVDVFAIGAMLWELCAMEKVPPVDRHQRHAMLRRNGVDRDLITILDKALAPDPAHRYRDAGELAADLKAFKAGARIAARSYSLPAVLAHWTRRHRALALSIFAAVALVIAGGTLYVRDIAAERDRADAALDALTLRHAQQLLATDPAAALDELARYRGTDTTRVHQIAAEAHGRGAPILRATPHHGNVLWIKMVPGPAGEPFGGVVSGSDDHTIVYTARDGSTRVLARNVMGTAQSLYSGTQYTAARQILAYVCEPDDVCLIDIARQTPMPSPPTLHGLHAQSVGFSPSGTALAVMSRTGTLTVFDVRDLAHPAEQMTHQLEGASDVQFVDDATIAIIDDDDISLLPIAHEAASRALIRFPFPDVSFWNVDPVSHRVIASSHSGSAMMIEGPDWHIAAHAELCHGWVSGIQSIPHRHDIAYTCQEGTVGFWDPSTGAVTPRAHLEGAAYRLRISPEGDCLVMAGGVAQVYVLDLVTDLLTNYKGFDVRPTAITSPTAEAPFVTVGNGRGEIRVWPVPPRIVKSVVDTGSMLTGAAFVPDSATLVATTTRSRLNVFSPATGGRTIAPHNGGYIFPVASPDSKLFAVYGRHDEVELWSVATMTRTRVIPTGHGAMSRLWFLSDSSGFVTAGKDGRIVRWTLASDAAPTPSTIVEVGQPIDSFVIAPATHAIVMQTRDGSLWQALLSSSTDRHPTRLAGDQEPSCATIRARLITLPDGFTVYCTMKSGDVLAIDTRDRHVSIAVHLPGQANEIATTPDGTTIAISTVTNALYIGTRPTPSAAWAWRPIELRTMDHAITADGVIIAAGNDGTLWLYSITRDRWLCLPVGSLDIHRVVIDRTDDAAAALTVDGQLLWLDLAAARKLLAQPPT
jgi:WD40 repeat protein